MHLGNPIAETVNDHAPHDRLISVQRIAGAAVIRVLRQVFVEDVIDFVCESAEAEGGALGIPLSGMVVDDIEDHLDAGAMKRLDEISELVDGTERILARTVAGMRSKKRDR